MSTPGRVRVYLACSLDGFIAGPGDDLGWLDEPDGARPVLVATHRPLEPVVPQVRAVAGDIGALLAEARRVAAGGDVYLDGGGPLFAGVAQRRRLALVAHHRYGRDMVQLVLRPLAVSPRTVPRNL